MRPAILFAFLLLAASRATAHEMVLNCRVDGQVIRVEAAFDNDAPAANAKVTLADERGAVLGEGRTDERGVWSCPAPPAGKYTVRVEETGHVETKELTVGAAADHGDHAGERKARGKPWTKVAIGIGVIVVIFGGIWLLRRRRTTETVKPEEP